MQQGEEAGIKELVPQVLTRTVELLNGGWLRGMDAADLSGQRISPYSSLACRFCTGGAMSRAALEILGCLPGSPEHRALFAASEKALISEVERSYAESEIFAALAEGRILNVTNWNDRLCASAEIAVLKLSRAAAAAALN